jgi:hypothetical protein
MKGYGGRSNLGALVTPVKTPEIYSIDLQSGKGVDAEVDIVRTQKEMSEGIVRYINVPVHTKSYGMLERWILPQDTVRKVTALLTLVRKNVLGETPYTKAVQELLTETERLLAEQAAGGGTPPERYTLAARIGLTILLSGQKLQVNCRSGKDRTGLFDSEIKFAAYQLWRRSQGLAVSAPGAEVLPSEMKAWELLLLRSGNREIQLVNAGVPGNKVSSHHLAGRVGKLLWETYVGEAEAALD